MWVRRGHRNSCTIVPLTADVWVWWSAALSSLTAAGGAVRARCEHQRRVARRHWLVRRAEGNVAAGGPPPPTPTQAVVMHGVQGRARAARAGADLGKDAHPFLSPGCFVQYNVLSTEDQLRFRGWSYVGKTALQEELVEFLTWQEEKVCGRVGALLRRLGLLLAAVPCVQQRSSSHLRRLTPCACLPRLACARVCGARGRQGFARPERAAGCCSIL